MKSRHKVCVQKLDPTSIELEKDLAIEPS